MTLYTKYQAVCAQLDGAIAAFEKGDVPCAITLAGAAEEAMPRQRRESLFDVLLASEKASGVHPSKVNYERNWLKHHNSKAPDELDLIHDKQIIWRALTRFDGVYPRSKRTALMSKFWATQTVKA